MTRKLLLSFLLIASVLGCAAVADGNLRQTKQQLLARRSYLWSLNSEHAGVRNSAVFRVMQYRLNFPQDDMQPFMKALREMSTKDTSSQNRLYAFIAVTFLENEELLKAANAPPNEEQEKEAYFTHLQNILQNNAVVARE